VPNKEIPEHLITIYPNPVSEILYISCENQIEPYTFKIVNLVGQIVKQGTISYPKTEINLVGMMDGYYLVQFQNGQQTVTKKFIKK
jgi:hypothetical protein